MDLSIRSETFGGDDQTWRASAKGTDTMRSITLDTSAFTEGTHYPDGYLPSGLPLGEINASGLYGPYTPASDEVVVLTRTSTGGTVTLTIDRETTATIPATAAGFTAAAVQAALEGLSNIDVGDVTVTGSDGGPITITFGGQYANENVPALTVDNTSATGGTITAATTAGGDVTSGLEVFAGFLGTPVKPGDPTTVDVQGVLQWEGAVVEANLPIAIDSVAKASPAGRLFGFF